MHTHTQLLLYDEPRRRKDSQDNCVRYHTVQYNRNSKAIEGMANLNADHNYFILVGFTLNVYIYIYIYIYTYMCAQACVYFSIDVYVSTACTYVGAHVSQSRVLR